MGKQEQREAKAKAAAESFEIIWQKALDVVKARQEEREVWPRPEGMEEREWDTACAVRLLREGGMAWWQLAHALALPGSGDSVATGKSGASYARRLYKRAFGDYEPGVRASSTGSAERRAEAVGPWFGQTWAMDEVKEAVEGKEITWSGEIQGVRFTDTAVVAPKRVQACGEDAITFDTVVYGEQEKGKSKVWWAGPKRTVRIADIIQVAPGIPAGERVFGAIVAKGR